MTLLGPKGQPISSSDFKKAPPPPTGEKFGNWSGENVDVMRLPGGGLLGFNLDELTLDDFRQMKDHYQINSSLSILTFMLHQVEWHIESDDKKLEAQATEMLENVWGRLVRSMSQSFWAGYSPNVLQWENDVQGKAIVLDKIKDLRPETCKVNWKRVDGQGAPLPDDIPGSIFPALGSSGKISVYDGIKQDGWAGAIPVENSFWYPLLMDHGDYYGKKLLRPAFQSWFFSILLHLFANRYYERFGEPTPVGRAPFDDEVDIGNGQTMTGKSAMELLLGTLRSRGTVVLPSTKDNAAPDETNPDFDYTIEYLESQMRGADFERYMTRLDEEMSLALFTPILLMRTADVGSYSLGEGHMQMYMLMLNAISSDWSQYINRYILAPIARFNSSRGASNPPKLRIKFRQLGKENQDIVRDAIRAGITNGRLEIDLTQLSENSGLTLKQVQDLTLPDTQLPSNDNPAKEQPNTGDKVQATAARLIQRVAPQVQKAYANGLPLGRDTVELGFQKVMTASFRESDYSDPIAASTWLYEYLKTWIDDAGNVYDTSEAYMRGFNLAINEQLKELKKNG